MSEINQMRADLATHVLMDWAGYVPEEMRARGLAWWKAELAADLEAAFQKSRPGVERNMSDLHRTIVSDNWRGLDGKLKLALEGEGCAEVFWPWLSEMNALVQDRSIQRFYERQRVCNPLDPFVAAFFLGTKVKNGQPEETLAAYKTLSPELRAGPLTIRAKFTALVMLGRFDEAHRLLATSPALSPKRELVRVETIRLLRLEGRTAEAEALHAELFETTTYITRRLVMAAWAGDQALVARLASEMDAMPLGHLKLLAALGMRGCGAAFPLDATPNFAARLAESGLPWPPRKRFPLPRAAE